MMIEGICTAGSRLGGKEARKQGTYTLIVFLNVSLACNFMLISSGYISNWSVLESLPRAALSQSFTGPDCLRHNLLPFPAGISSVVTFNQQNQPSARTLARVVQLKINAAVLDDKKIIAIVPVRCSRLISATATYKYNNVQRKLIK